MEKNQIWLWYKDEVLVDFFAIKDIDEYEGEMAAILYGPAGDSHGKFRLQFFDDMELLENITDMFVPEEAKLVYDFCNNTKFQFRELRFVLIVLKGVGNGMKILN